MCLDKDKFPREQSLDRGNFKRLDVGGRSVGLDNKRISNSLNQIANLSLCFINCKKCLTFIFTIILQFNKTDYGAQFFN